MKSYIKPAMTAVLVLMFMLLTGFRAQTIIHDDGSETQDVLKVSDRLGIRVLLKVMPMSSKSATIQLWIMTTATERDSAP